MKKTKAKNKKILFIFIILIFLIGVSVVINASTIDNPTTINFEDAVLYEMVKTELTSKPNDIKIQTIEDDETLKEFEIRLSEDDLLAREKLTLQGASGYKIANLNGIERFANLKELDVSGNAITNMETVSQITTLTNLNMSRNNLSVTNSGVLSTIQQLTNLTDLNLANTQLDSVGILSSLVNLESLNIAGNQFNDLTPISNLTSIKKLDLSNNRSIETIATVVSLEGMKELNISNTGITTLHGVQNMTQLEKLYAANITGLIKDSNDRLAALFALDSEENVMLKNLKVLDLSSLGILETKDAQGNVIQKANQAKIDFDNLATLTALEELYLENMGIDKLDGIINCINLKRIDLANNKIDSDALADIISEQDDEVADENVFKATHIELQYNDIIDISVFGKYPANIQYLDLRGNHIYEISSLSKHDFSERIDLRQQNIKFSIYDKKVEVDNYIVLPEILKASKIEGSIVYSENDYTTTGLQLNPKYTNPNDYNVIIDSDKTKDDTLSIKINGGNADGTVLTYVIGMSASSSHNGYVTESLFFNDEIFYAEMLKEIMNDPQGQGYQKSIGKSLVVLPNEIININRQVIDKMVYLMWFSNKSITDITGIENCSKVKEIYLQGNNILTIQPLEACTQLVNLRLANNKNLGDNNSAIEKLTNLTYLDLSNTGMTNINSINNLINRTSRTKIIDLNISDNGLQDITGIEKITSLQNLYIANEQLDNDDLSLVQGLTGLATLDMSGNQISDISVLANLLNLTHLYFANNKVESIEALTGKVFTELDISGNQIKDITPLSSHNSINKLLIDNNRIEDVSVLDNILISENGEFSATGQKITRILSENSVGEVSIPLPQIFKAAKTERNKIYSSADLDFSNCQLDSTGENLIININSENSSVAQVKINNGKANRTTLTITIPLIPTIEYSVAGNVLTNQNVTATVTFNRNGVTIKNNQGKNTYVFEKNGEFTFEYYDEYGFEGTITAEVKNIDKDAPIITGVENGKKYNKSVKPVIKDVNLKTVTLTKDGAIVNDYQSGTVIDKNGKYVLTAKDVVENTKTVSFEIYISDIITSDKVTVKEDQCIIKGISPNTTSEELRNMLNSEMEYKVVDKNGNTVSATTNVGTGYKIKMANDKIYTLIVPGDCNGDGKVTVREDMMLVNAHRLSGNTLTGSYITAADVDGNGEIKVNDMILINAIRLRQNT